MTAFETTWNAWLGYVTAVACILLVVYTVRRAMRGHKIYAEIAWLTLLTATAIFSIYFSQRAGEMEIRVNEELDHLKQSVELAPPMPSKAEIEAGKKQQDKDNLVHSGKSLEEHTAEANKAMDEAIKRWEGDKK